MERTLPSESVEYVGIAIQANSDPTAGAVSIGFSDTDDAPDTWTLGQWDAQPRTVSAGTGFTHAWVAQFLFGTGDLDLDEGVYFPWIRLVRGSETVVRKTDDTIVIT